MTHISMGNIQRKQRRGPEHHLAFTAEKLAAAQEAVVAEAPDAHGLAAALEEVIECGKVEPTVEHYSGLVVATGDVEQGRKHAIEGLMFVEATDLQGHIATAATVSIWVARVDAYLPDADNLRNNAMTSQRAEQIRRKFYGTALSNVNEIYREPGQGSAFFSLSTRSSTLITPVGNQDKDIQVPFHHGDWRDALRVSELDVADDLKQTVIASVMGHHASRWLAEYPAAEPTPGQELPIVTA